MSSTLQCTSWWVCAFELAFMILIVLPLFETCPNIDQNFTINVNLTTNEKYFNLSRSDNNRLKMLEDHVTKHSLRDQPHSMCKVCTRILEGK